MVGAALATVGGLVLVTIGVAGATGSDHKPAAGPPGNNGTVKIHEADEPTPVTRNEPHVCTFHVHAAGFDSGQVLTLQILSWQPTGDRSTVLTATITADASGEGRAPEQGAFSLPDGHYRLVVDTGNGTPTQDKHKMFWVKCPQPTPSESESQSPSESPSESPSTSPPTSPTSPSETTPTPPPTSALAGDTTAPAPGAPVPSPGAVRLASTGVSALSPLTLSGVGLLVFGLALTWMVRRRPAGTHR
jgi:hypothetical protein